jgi:hypothetical protein
MDYESILKMVKQQNFEYNLSYKDILADIKEKNPELPYKDAQKQASERFKKLQAEAEKKAKDTFAKFEKARNELKNSMDLTTMTSGIKSDDKSDKSKESTANKSKIPEGIPVDELFAAEERIRKEGPNRNTIMRLGGQVIPKGQLKIHGQEGPNKLVTWEDNEGNCIPISGYFKIFLVQ